VDRREGDFADVQGMMGNRARNPQENLLAGLPVPELWLVGTLRSKESTWLNLGDSWRLQSPSVTCRSHPDLWSEVTSAAVSVGPIFCHSILSPSLDA
jgi:hypothetical protein